VLVTWMDPWRIYIYKEGLARFASEPYTAKGNKTNRFSHLTNYSINKKHEKFVQNTHLEMDDEGNKWSLSALSKHLESIGVDMNLLWSRIYDIILKSLLWVDTHIYTAMKKIPGFKNNWFELYGFDILVDSNLRPWILEVNLSPSLATDSPLDLAIKSNLLTDVFNLIGIRKIDRRRDNITKVKQRFKNYSKPKQNQSRGVSTSNKNQNIFKLDSNNNASTDDYLDKNVIAMEKLSQLSSKNRAIIRDTLIEDQRKGNFVRIYPTRDSDIYDQYFLSLRVTNKMVHKYLFTDEIIQTDVPKSFWFSSYNQNKRAVAPKDDSSITTKINNHINRSSTNSESSTFDYATASSATVPNHNASASSAIAPKLPDVPKTKSQTSKKNASTSLQAETEQNTEKLMITGDDVLIEYVARLMIAIKSIKEVLVSKFNINLLHSS